MTYGFSTQTGASTDKVVWDSDAFSTGTLLETHVLQCSLDTYAVDRNAPSSYYAAYKSNYATNSVYPNGDGWVTFDLSAYTEFENIALFYDPCMTVDARQNQLFGNLTEQQWLYGAPTMSLSAFNPPYVEKSGKVFRVKYAPYRVENWNGAVNGGFWTQWGEGATYNTDYRMLSYRVLNALFRPSCRIKFIGY